MENLKNFTSNGISYEWETEPDPARLKKIFFDSFYSAYKDLSPETLRIKTGIREWLSDYFTDNWFHKLKETGQSLLVAKLKNHPVGCAVFDLNQYPKEVYISELAVDSSFQGKGIGKNLVFSILHSLSETQKIVLITRKVNRQSLAFYQALGFKECSYMHPATTQNCMLDLNFYLRIRLTYRFIK